MEGRDACRLGERLCAAALGWGGCQTTEADAGEAGCPARCGRRARPSRRRTRTSQPVGLVEHYPRPTRRRDGRAGGTRGCRRRAGGCGSCLWAVGPSGCQVGRGGRARLRGLAPDARWIGSSSIGSGALAGARCDLPGLVVSLRCPSASRSRTVGRSKRRRPRGPPRRTPPSARAWSVDPVALDAQLARDGRGVDEPARARGAVLVQQLDHAPGDPLDVVGDQAEGAVVVVGVHLSGCRWKAGAGLQLWGRLVAR